MAHHQADPSRLELLTKGADIGGGRFWRYTSEADEDPFIQHVNFWIRTTQVRPGAGILVIGEGQYVGTLWAFTRQGLERSGLDVIIKTLSGEGAALPPPGPSWDDTVRDSVCRLMGCGG